MARCTPGLFITGTDTDAGKTYVASLIARSLAAEGRRVGVYKPAASGCRRVDGELVSVDAVSLWNAAGRPDDLAHVCPQRFETPVAPNLAARREGRELDADLLRRGLDYWLERSDIVLVEGAGGLMAPLGETMFVADLAAEFGFPLIVVARNVLGTINHALQTLIAASVRCPGVPVAGIVFNNTSPATNDASLSSNRRELAIRCQTPILAEAAFGADRFDAAVDWFSLARPGGARGVRDARNR